MKLMPSTNPCPEDTLVKYAKELSDAGVTFMHCDVMDGEFVENKCLDIEVVRSLRNNVNIGLDVHLMVADTMAYVKEYIKLKPNFITIHYESPKSIKEMNKIIKLIKSKGILIGMAISPDTPVCMLEPFIIDLDMVLMMSVVPGKSGQTFIDGSMDRFREAKALIDRLNHLCKLEVDGGITLGGLKDLKKIGVDYVVMGSALYKADKKERLEIISNFEG